MNFYKLVHKLDVNYDGLGSVISFNEEVGQLSESRGIPESQLFLSIYELLRGDAHDLYVTQKKQFIVWNDFKRKLKDTFTPLNYEESLLEDIRRRTQRIDERVILYVTRTQNLFRRLL